MIDYELNEWVNVLVSMDLGNKNELVQFKSSFQQFDF